MRLAVLGLALAVAGIGGASAQQAASAPALIEVSATAIVSVAPNEATVPVTVAGADETAEAATARTEVEVRRLVAFMKTLGAMEDDIRVEPTRVMPRGRPQTYPLVKPGTAAGPALAPGEGFEATSQIQVRFGDLYKAARFTAQARDNGASAINPIRYKVADPADGADKARQAAFDAARRKAERLATMAGLKLGRVVRITMPSRDVFSIMADASRAATGAQTDDVVRIQEDLPKGANAVEVRASLEVAWSAE